MKEKHFVVKNTENLRIHAVNPSTNKTEWFYKYGYNKDTGAMTPTNKDLYTLINLRESIIQKLKAYNEFHYDSPTAQSKIDKAKNVAQNEEKKLRDATIEIDKEIAEFEVIAKKYWGDDRTSNYAETTDARYFHDDNQMRLTNARTKIKTEKGKSEEILKGLHKREGVGYTTFWSCGQPLWKHNEEYDTSKGYHFVYSAYRDHAIFPVLGIFTWFYSLPVLIGCAIVHGIDALIQNVRAVCIDFSAEGSFIEEINNIEDSIKSDETVLVQQTLFEITREFKTDEYKNFSTQRSNLENVGFFAVKPEAKSQVSNNNAANDSADKVTTPLSNNLYPSQ
jgi:hypothetical protein